MDGRESLRHFLAALAYRLQKSVRGAPEAYWALEAGGGVRTPRRIVRHVNSVLSYALLVLQTGDPDGRTELHDLDWPAKLERFHATLQSLDQHLSSHPNLSDELARRLLQGPLSDAMTHVGQLAMLRRLAGSPVPSENFIKADVRAGRVGPEQPEPVSPDRE